MPGAGYVSKFRERRLQEEAAQRAAAAKSALSADTQR